MERRNPRGKPLPAFLLAPFFAALALFWLVPILKSFQLSLQAGKLEAVQEKRMEVGIEAQ